MLRKLTFFNRALHSLCLFNPSAVDFWVDWANLLGSGFRGDPAHGAGEDGLESTEAGAILLDEAEASQSASIAVVVAVEAGHLAAFKEWLPVLVIECVPVTTSRADSSIRLLGSLKFNFLDSCLRRLNIYQSDVILVVQIESFTVMAQSSIGRGVVVLKTFSVASSSQLIGSEPGGEDLIDSRKVTQGAGFGAFGFRKTDASLELGHHLLVDEVAVVLGRTGPSVLHLPNIVVELCEFLELEQVVAVDISQLPGVSNVGIPVRRISRLLGLEEFLRIGLGFLPPELLERCLLLVG